jgi:membrane protein DedA with SNARE-associated domain
MDNAFATLLDQNTYIIYIALFILIFLENIVPFVPGDTVLVFAAYLSGRGTLAPLLTFILTVCGSLLGFCFIFYLSGTWGYEVYRKLHLPRISQQKRTKYKRHFQKHGGWSLMVGRIIPGSRLILALTAGLVKMPVFKSIAMTLIGVLVWNGIIFRSGMLLGEHWELIKSIITKYSTLVNCLFIVLVIGVVFYKFVWPKITAADKHE